MTDKKKHKDEYSSFSTVDQLILMRLDEIDERLKEKCNSCPTTIGLEDLEITHSKDFKTVFVAMSILLSCVGGLAYYLFAHLIER